MKTEGQRLLCAVDATGVEIAERVGVSKQAVSYWRNGDKVPNPAQRAALELAFGVARDAWDRLPVVGDEEEEASPEPPRKREKKPTTLAEVEDQIDRLLVLQDEPGLVASARLKIADAMARQLALKARLERDLELLEDKIVRQHPRWRAIRAAVLNALRAHPEALAAVEQALADIGEEGQE